MKASRASLLTLAVALVTSGAGCSRQVYPDLKYPSCPPAEGEPEAVISVMRVVDDRPNGEIVGGYGNGSALGYSLTYVLSGPYAIHWTTEAIAAELRSRGAESSVTEEDPGGWTVTGRLLGARYVHTVIRWGAALSMLLELRRDGRVIFSRTYTRTGEASGSSFGPSSASSEAFTGALRVILDHGLSEILQVVRSPAASD